MPGAVLPEARRMLAWIAVAELFGLTLWFSATAAAQPIAAEFNLGRADTAWLTMAVQAGFVAGTLTSASLNLADVFNARRLFAIGCLAGAAANAAIAVVDAAAAVLALRFATGAALACVYPPGLKIAAGWFLERRGTALGVVVGALTVGSAFPHLLAWAAAGIAWRHLLLVSSALTLVAAVTMVRGVRDGPYVSASAPFDPRAIAAVLRNRRTRLAVLGYLGHMWELYALWTWMPALAAAWILGAGGGAPRVGSLVAFVTIASGAVGCVVAGRWADEWGKPQVAGGSMVVSAACCLAATLLFGLPSPVLFGLAVVWGFSVVSDSAQFSALVAEYSARTHVGTALTLQLCAGFLLTMISMRLLPWAADAWGWALAPLLLLPGPVLGAAAMRRLATLSQ
jgi:MFS family permease